MPAQDENTSTAVPAILAAVAAVMQQVTYVKKAGQYESGRGQNKIEYTFRKFEDTAAALGIAFREHKIFVQSEVVERTVGEFDKKPYSTGSGYTVWTSVFVTVRYTFTSLIDGSTLSVSAAGEGKDSSDKASAKAMTMAMKSALTQGFMIATDDPDPDSTRPGDDAPAIGSGRGLSNQQQEQQAQARRRQQQEQRQGEVPAAGDNSSEARRQQFLTWVVEQLRPHDGSPTTLRKVASAYWNSHRLNMLQFETEGGVPLEHRIRAVLASFVQDPRGPVPTVEEIDARTGGGS